MHLAYIAFGSIWSPLLAVATAFFFLDLVAVLLCKNVSWARLAERNTGLDRLQGGRMSPEGSVHQCYLFLHGFIHSVSL